MQRLTVIQRFADHLPVPRTIGIVGGLGPYAGYDLVRKIFRWTRASRDQDHLPLMLHSFPGWIPERPAFLLGARRRDCALSLLRWDAGRGFSATALGHGGSSNVSVFSLPGQDVVVSANQTAGEAAVYVLEDVPCETSPATV